MKKSVLSHVADLERAARGGVVAFFDLDRTLIAGYSLTALARQQLFSGRMSVRTAVSISLVTLGYGLGARDYESVLRATVEDIRGMPEAELVELGRQAFRRRLSGWVYQEGGELIAAHQQRGNRVVLVTSATRYQAEPVASALGIDHVLCTLLEVVDGRVSGGMTPCYGWGKLRAASAFLAEHDAAFETAYFYSDSPEDLPLLERVGNPVAVNAKPKLARIAAARGWPRLEFEKKLGAVAKVA